MKAYRIVNREDSRSLTEYLTENGQLLLPMVELIEASRMLVPKSGVQADAREWADLALGVAKNPIARVSILARFSGPSRGRFRHGHNLYLLAMTPQSFPRPKPRRTGAS